MVADLMSHKHVVEKVFSWERYFNQVNELCLMPDDFICQREKLSPLTLCTLLKNDLEILLSNTRQFYMSKGDPLRLKGLKSITNIIRKV